MNCEDSLALAAKRIGYLERRLDEVEADYDRMVKDAYKFRKLAQRFEFAIRDHRESILNSRSESAANVRLWGKLKD